jgi:octaprenyl-diphosphate synthase
MREITQSYPSDSFSAKIDFYRGQVDTALNAELHQRRQSPFFAPFVDAFTGGKRLRPILLLLAYDSVSGRDGDPLPAAVAVEFAHMESLIHDDIIDGDQVRRDATAFHARYGQEMALLSADFILSMILSIVARYSDPYITRALATATAQMCEGELMERLISETNKAVGPAVYQRIVLKKTAALFEAAATMGALIGGASPVDLCALASYARALGVAYQIRDDITDSAYGRTIMLDLKETGHSQNEYLRDMATESVCEAVRRLNPLRSSEAKQYLVELAERIDSRPTDQI